MALRARIALPAASSNQNNDVAVQIGVGRVQVARWRERFAHLRVARIDCDVPRGTSPTTVDDARLVTLTTQSQPEAATRRSARSITAALGVNAAGASRH